MSVSELSNSPIDQLAKSRRAVLAPFALILIRTNGILRAGDWIVGQAVFVDAVSLRVAHLLVARTVAFNRAFVHVGIVARCGLCGHGRLLDVCTWNSGSGGCCYNRRMVQRTLAIIKADAVERRLAGRILSRIEEQGFQIRAMRRVHLSAREAEGFYDVHRARPFFGSLTAFMSSGPAIVLVLEAEDAIRKWRTLMGATDPAKADAGTMRKEFAQSIERNATHGSDAPDTAAYEIGYFFPGIDLI